MVERWGWLVGTGRPGRHAGRSARAGAGSHTGEHHAVELRDLSVDCLIGSVIITKEREDFFGWCFS